ncbi:MAG: FAD-dependent oxidoreductase, partial [Erysipelotrichaceae bacterium]
MNKYEKKLNKFFPQQINVEIKDNKIILEGELNSWAEVVQAGKICATKYSKIHVVNHIKVKGLEFPKMRIPNIQNNELENSQPDVLIIGGGINGCAILRELSRYQLNLLLIEKESDVALAASGRNDGEIHPGVDLGKGSLKQKYVVQGNRMYDQISKELDVPFKRVGQYVAVDKKYKPLLKILAWQRKYICKVDDTKVLSGEEVHKLEPALKYENRVFLANPMAGSVCPYGLTIAYAENAITNGAKISLNTAALSIETNDHKIISVTTNKGTIYPKYVINCAGVYSDEIAKMANDEFFTIHPRS